MSMLPEITPAQFMLPVSVDVPDIFLANPLLEREQAIVSSTLTGEALRHGSKWSNVRTVYIQLWDLKDSKLTQYQTGFAVGFKILSLHAEWLSSTDCAVPQPSPRMAKTHASSLKAKGIDEKDFFLEYDEKLSVTDPAFYVSLENYAQTANGELHIANSKEIQLGGYVLYATVENLLEEKQKYEQETIKEEEATREIARLASWFALGARKVS